MKKILAMVILLVAFSSTASAQSGGTKIGGVIMPNVMKVGDKYLKMNGGGIREKYWINLYIGCLYVTNKSSDQNKIINADEPMAIKMRIVSGMVSNSNLRRQFEREWRNPLAARWVQFRTEWKL